jgi:hypothetical protein
LDSGRIFTATVGLRSIKISAEVRVTELHGGCLHKQIQFKVRYVVAMKHQLLDKPGNVLLFKRPASSPPYSPPPRFLTEENVILLDEIVALDKGATESISVGIILSTPLRNPLKVSKPDSKEIYRFGKLSDSRLGIVIFAVERSINSYERRCSLNKLGDGKTRTSRHPGKGNASHKLPVVRA